jgi:putative Holliday junction resolvase
MSRKDQQPESSPADFPSSGRLLGIDFGRRRVGVAISTGDRSIASPADNYQRRNAQLDARYFESLKADYHPVGVVVGLPMHVNGSEGQMAQEAREYGQWLGKLLRLPVYFWDERFTSAIAEDYLLAADLSRQRRKERIDKLAAQIMLQSFLDAHRPRPPQPEHDLPNDQPVEEEAE